MELKINAEDLARWLEQQGHYVYWTVDGDPLLGGRLSFPCPSDELAAELRRIDKPLRVVRPHTAPAKEGKPVPTLDDFVDESDLGTRVLELRWEECDDDETWILIEDEETSESVLHEMRSG